MAFDLQFVDSIGEIYAPITDTFTRTVANGWGTADTGEVWTTSGGAASDYSVSAGTGRHSLGSVAVFRHTVLSSGFADSGEVWSVRCPVTATGASIIGMRAARRVDENNTYRIEVSFEVAGTVGLRIRKVFAGALTSRAYTNPLTYIAGTKVWVRQQVVGTLIRARFWLDGTVEPSSWTVSATDADLSAAGGSAFSSVLNSGNTNTLPVVLEYDNFTLTSPTSVRLDLNDDLPWRTLAEGTEFGTPPLRRAVVSTLMQDGEHVSAAAYGNRMLTLTLDCQLPDTDFDGAATAFQTLSRELDRPGNFLRYRPGTTEPVFFRTMRSDFNSVVWDAVLRRASVRVLAEPFAYGLRETLPSVTVYNDPAEGSTLNANPFFETDVANWTATGGTFVRSTAQFHEGVASGLLTPDGVSAAAVARSELLPATVGTVYRVSAWVRCATARTVEVQVLWFDAGGTQVDSNGTALSVSAGVWTFGQVFVAAPVGASQAAVAVRMTGTPPITDLLYVDEARLRQSGGVGGMCWDVTGVKGDVETPLKINLPLDSSNLAAPGQMSVLAVRRCGTPSAAPFVLQAESMTQGISTTVQANSATMSGPGSNFSRTAFASTSHIDRLSILEWPPAAGVDVRGRYRVFVAVQKSVAGDAIDVQMRWGKRSILPVGHSMTGRLVRLGSTTSRHLVDLGVITIPSSADAGVDGYSGTPVAVRGQAISFWAARVSGSGNLDWDYAVFVPADDRFLRIDWGDPISNDFTDLAVLDGPNDTLYPIDAAGNAYGVAVPDGLEGAFPAVRPGVTNRMYLLRSVGLDSVDVVTKTTDVQVAYWPRYLGVRPATT